MRSFLNIAVLCPNEGPEVLMTAPTLTLCVIARDEQQFLTGCLASVEGVVDQIVVVDTGSIDDTVALAQAAGALVVHSPWQDDFSHARNASLAAATGDYVLILDADERLAPGGGAALRAAIADRSLDCGMLPLHNAVDLDALPADVVSGVARAGQPVLLPRLLRRTADLQYTGAVHETISGWLTAGNRQVTAVSAALVHYGYVAEIREARDKDARNLRLLERRCAESPDDAVARGYLARELLRTGDTDRALTEARAGWAALRCAIEGDGPNPAFVSLASLLAHTCIGAGDVAEATAVLTQAEAWRARHPNLDLLQGWAAEARAVGNSLQVRTLLESARCSYEACLAAHGEDFVEEVMPGATTWAARTRLGTVLLRLGESQAAADAFGQAQVENPSHLEAELGSCEALIELGQVEEALRAIEPTLQHPVPDGWTLAARALYELGVEDEAAPLMTRALELSTEGFVAPHRRTQLLELRCMDGLYTGRPMAGPGWGGLLGAIASRQPVMDHSLLGEQPPGNQVEDLMGFWLANGRTDLLEPFLEPRADSLIPGLKRRCMTALQALGVDVSDDGEPEFVFIGGAGRSGTTLLRAMLDAHPRIACGPELKLVPAICSLRDQWWSAMGHDLLAAGLNESKLDAAVRSFVTTLLEGMVSDPSEVRIAEKTPHNLLHMSMLGRLYPRARFVHVVRDGRAVAASLVRQAWKDPSTGEPVWYCKDPASGARYWSQVVQTIREQSAQVPGRYLELRYEDLVRQPRVTMARLLAFLGEAWHEDVLSHHDQVRVSSLESSSAAVAGPVTTSAVDRWRSELRPEDLEAIGLEAGGLLQEWSDGDRT